MAYTFCSKRSLPFYYNLNLIFWLNNLINIIKDVNLSDVDHKFKITKFRFIQIEIYLMNLSNMVCIHKLIKIYKFALKNMS